MTTKLTLTIDDAVITGAKKYAQTSGRSLSAVVENYLKSIATAPEIDNEISPRVLRLMGVIKFPEKFDYKTALANAIVKKHAK